MRGRHTEAAEELDDMREDEPPGGGEDVRPRSKHGAGKLLPGPSLDITFWMMKKQVTQIDWLASEIRAGAGMWITRSAIVTAIIEAALRSETRGDLLDASHERSLRAHFLNHPQLLQQEERLGKAGTRVLRVAKYLRQKQKRLAFDDKPASALAHKSSLNDRSPRESGERHSLNDNTPSESGEKSSLNDNAPRESGERSSLNDNAPRE